MDWSFFQTNQSNVPTDPCSLDFRMKKWIFLQEKQKKVSTISLLKASKKRSRSGEFEPRTAREDLPRRAKSLWLQSARAALDGSQDEISRTSSGGSSSINWKLAEGSCFVELSGSVSLDDELAAHKRLVGDGSVLEVVMDMLTVNVGFQGIGVLRLIKVFWGFFKSVFGFFWNLSLRYRGARGLDGGSGVSRCLNLFLVP